MLAEALRSRLLLSAAVLPPLLVLLFFAIGGGNWRASFHGSENPHKKTVTIEEMKTALAQDRLLLSTSEREQAVLRNEVIKRRKLFQEGQISKDQVVDAEQSFVAALRRVHELRYSVTETDIAITEAVLGEKVERLPPLPVGGFSETAEFTRFNGPFRWSIKETPRVEKFFAQTFGRSLPITALGQSHTHDRLGFDHRDSLDIGVHPDSVEGRKLIEYLRKMGIPFLAFRQAVPGVATGPHIHIGNPSRRLAS